MVMLQADDFYCCVLQLFFCYSIFFLACWSLICEFIMERRAKLRLQDLHAKGRIVEWTRSLWRFTVAGQKRVFLQISQDAAAFLILGLCCEVLCATRCFFVRNIFSQVSHLICKSLCNSSWSFRDHLSAYDFGHVLHENCLFFRCMIDTCLFIVWIVLNLRWHILQENVSTWVCIFMWPFI